MTLPPERISVKRRRQEEPVEALYLEPDLKSTKRRFTDFFFQRLKANEIPPTRVPKDNGHSPSRPDDGRSVTSFSATSVPLVRATSPGAEFRDAAARNAVRSQRLEELRKRTAAITTPEITSLTTSDVCHFAGTRVAPIHLSPSTRRFHLARTNLASLSSRNEAGIRKHKSDKKSYLATFVEKYSSSSGGNSKRFLDKKFPIDRILSDAEPQGVVRPKNVSSKPREGSESLSDPGISIEAVRVSSRPFMKAPAGDFKTGNSIRDHPSTWDHESDQLAAELAAFALEISQDHSEEVESGSLVAALPLQTTMTSNSDPEMNDDYVYETYVRVAQSPGFQGANGNTVGLLVIEDQDEELWEAFAEHDENSKWDEEDADSNAEDNPANDYPEDEVSSDDGFGYGAYRYRHRRSDEEDYDLNNDPWSDDEA